MKLTRKVIAVLTSVALTVACFTGCKKQEPPAPEPVLEDENFKDLASEAGAAFFEAFRTRNVTNMATLSEESLRTSFVDKAEDYYNYVENSIWIEEFYNLYLYDIQVVESTFTREDDDYGQTTYKIIIANYNSDQTGALVSYDVKLEFVADAKTESVYVINPELAIQLYEDMVDDYARYLLDMNYSVLAEPTPEPTPEPTATPTPVPPPPQETSAPADPSVDPNANPEVPT